MANIEEKPDVIVVDPPRAGIMPKALAQILSYGVNQIVYISCNPKTLAENLRAAKLLGYETKQITAYDNFPFTKHIEGIVAPSVIDQRQSEIDFINKSETKVDAGSFFS